jgi:hypothetical protein
MHNGLARSSSSHLSLQTIGGETFRERRISPAAARPARKTRAAGENTPHA